MSETDSRRGSSGSVSGNGNGRNLKTISENSPLLSGGVSGGATGAGGRTGRSGGGDEEPEIYGDYPMRQFCSKTVFITFFFLLGLLVLHICVNDRPIDAVIGPEDIPARIVEDVVLPDRSRTLSVAYDPEEDSYHVLTDPLDNTATARATYHTNVNGNGWNYFEAKALPASTSYADYFNSLRAMGYLEGYTSWKQIVDFYPNYYQSIFDTKNPVLCNPDMRIMRYLQDNYDFMQTQSLKHYETSEYWLVVRGILAQLDGLLAGFMDGQASIDEGNARRVLHKDKEGDTVLLTDKEKDDALAALDMTTIDKPSLLHFLLLNGNGDMFTLIEKLADGDKKNNITFSGVDCSRTSRRLTEELKMDEQAMDGNFVYEYGTSVLDRKRAKLTGQGQDGYRTDHCSALVKVLPDGSDVIYGHNTWDDYRNMGPRIFKHYIYPKWPLNVVSYHSKCRPQGTKCMKQCAIREKSPPSHTYFSSSPGWLTSVDDFYTTFTTPFPSSAGDGDVDTNTDGGILCGCECGRQVSEQASIEDGDVMILETANEVESAVRENILDARVTAVEGASPPSSPVKSGGGRLAIIETSLEIYSPELYDLIVPTTLLSWVRARTANTLAQSGADWAKHFSFDHSGTYPNQWIILDFDKFSKSNSYFKKSELLPGFLTIMEEMPGMIRSKDQTEYLKKNTYWASYNIPFYNDLSLYSKNTQLCQTQQNVYVHKNETLPGVDANANSDMENYRLGHSNCYSSCARAKLFARLHKDIVDIPSALKVLSHNDYKHDKESFGNPCEEIACREDLQPLDEKMNVFGAIDTKVSSVVEADTLYRGTSSVIKGHDTVLKDSSPTVLSDDLTPKPLTFPLPLIEPEVEDISIQGGDDSVDMMSSRPRDDRSSSPLRYKMPRLFARQGPTHDTQNKPFCWSDFEARHDAWVVRTRGSLTPTGRRRLREGGEKWRKRKPAFRYSHLGQPNCYAYEWQVMPPQ